MSYAQLYPLTNLHWKLHFLFLHAVTVYASLPITNGSAEVSDNFVKGVICRYVGSRVTNETLCKILINQSKILTIEPRYMKQNSSNTKGLSICLVDILRDKLKTNVIVYGKNAKCSKSKSDVNHKPPELET
jgi:hypothetical protein